MSAPIVLENTSRRDTLIEIEKRYQKVWAEAKLFEVNAPTIEEEPVDVDPEELRERIPKHFATMAYPYMNGVLHAGHSFTLSKVEFATGFERMQGKRALFPMGFHCTGMPIKASADKIAREVEQFGADFSGVPAESEEVEEAPKAAVTKSEDVSKFKAKKSKAVAKQGRGKYQFEIMMQLGIPKEEVAQFADPLHWLYYFPELCEQDITAFGGRVDWRRSFITTDVNPYYDSFVRWQITRLRECGKIKFGERYTIYSEKDGQPCMDHDRSSGEAVTPQEYTGIKIEVTEFAPAALEALAAANFTLEGKKVFLVAATLRPETMYGQTCCFVSPKITYGVFDAGNNNYYICTERSFKNMAFQKLTPQKGVYASAATISGKALVGSKIHAPLAIHQELRVLPMETVLANKGTGVVTCVPSDSPDDFVTTRELCNKPEYYGIEKEWAAYEPVALINTKKYGDKCAEFLVNEMKIQSPKDSVQLAAAKELAYKEGFYNGTMIHGAYTGLKVEEAKPKVKADLIAAGLAFVYNEPESVVVSRSGDDCIVSLEDQWYIDYGEEQWKSQALDCLEHMNCFATETRNGFEGVLDWLKNWAVSRTYGLGTKIPWDEKYLVESLSDSTIYMAYYTVCHFLHSDYYGKELGSFKIAPEQMTLEVWDYIFARRDDIETTIPLAQLQLMRREFEYFYPLDVRVSGKDLIPNHLTFFIYSHVALFPKQYWPRGIRANGHLMLNNAKMAKSTGNFMTLKQIVEKYGADASRIAIADAGDTVEDANFDESNANAAILRLFTLREWCEDVLKAGNLRVGEYDKFFDVAFENEMNVLIEETFEQYKLTNYKAALKTGLFDFQTSRDFYRDNTQAIGMHKDLVLRFIEAQALMLAPIAPHFAEYLYKEVLGKTLSVHNAAFPRASKPISKAATDALEYVRAVSRGIRETEGAMLKKKKGKAPEVDPKAPSKLQLLISPSFPEWQLGYIDMVRELFEAQSLNDSKLLKEKVGKDMKRAMPFISILKNRLVTEKPETVFNRELSFNEVETVKSVMSALQKAPSAFNVVEVEAILLGSEGKGQNVITGETVEVTAAAKTLESAVPGEPAVVITNL